MLPQQSLALWVAAEAIADAGWDDRPRLRAGVFVGIGLDLNTTNFHFRWSLLEEARRWNRQLGLDLSDEELRAWTAALRDAAGPPLTANRTMGALGGLVASRIAREFRVGGPSFTVSSEETSGARALDVAVRLLRQGELDEAIVGAVDLACDLRAVLSADRVHPFSPSGTVRPLAAGADGTVPADGAAALVLKRLDDAVARRRPGLRRDPGHRRGRRGRRPGVSGRDAPGPRRGGRRPVAGRLPRGARQRPGGRGPARGRGAGRGGPGLARGVPRARWDRRRATSGTPARRRRWRRWSRRRSACTSRSCPRSGRAATLRPELAASPFFAPRGPQFWLRDRAEGPPRGGRRAGHRRQLPCIVLEAYEPAAARRHGRSAQPLGARPARPLRGRGRRPAGLIRGIEDLDALAARSPNAPIEALARAGGATIATTPTGGSAWRWWPTAPQPSAINWRPRVAMPKPGRSSSRSSRETA